MCDYNMNSEIWYKIPVELGILCLSKPTRVILMLLSNYVSVSLVFFLWSVVALPTAPKTYRNKHKKHLF